MSIIGLHGYERGVGAPPPVTDDKAILFGVIGAGLVIAGIMAMRKEEEEKLAASSSPEASKAREAELRRRGYEVERVPLKGGGSAVLKRGRALWP